MVFDKRGLLAVFLAVLSVVTLTGCTSEKNEKAPHIASEQVEDSILKGKPILLKQQDIERLENNKMSYKVFLDSVQNQLAYTPHPVEKLNLDPQYIEAEDIQTANHGAELKNDATMAYRFALAYVISGNQAYARKTQEILDAWAHTLKEIHSQQSINNVNGDFLYMFIAASWVKEANDWNHKDFDHFVSFLLRYTMSYDIHNQGFWGILFTTTGAYYLGDMQLVDKMVVRWKALIDESIDPSGVFPREITRSDSTYWRGGPHKGIKGLAYTHYAMLPISMIMVIFDQAGRPQWTSPEGQQVALAYDQVARWVLQPETFPYYESNGGHLYEINNCAYFLILHQYFTSEAANLVIEKNELKMDGFQLKLIYKNKKLKKSN